MPRIRSIKPEFFASEDVSALPLRARLTWIGLWTQCDDHGRTKRNAKLIKAAIWPLDDVSLRDVEEDLHTLADLGRIVSYEVDSTPLLAVVNWHVHQSINRPGRPRHAGPPEPLGTKDANDPHYCAVCSVPGPVPLTADSVSVHGGLTPGGEGKGREGRGRAREASAAANGPPRSAPEPPRKCDEHQRTRNPPNCGKCADQRKRHDEWLTDHNERQRLAAKCSVHRGQLAHNCGVCRSEELSPA